MNDQLEQKVSHLLRLHEGFVSHVYEDSTPEKYLTIGYGRLVDERLGHRVQWSHLVRGDGYVYII